jgi:polysaccharide export outer membrane protein
LHPCADARFEEIARHAPASIAFPRRVAMASADRPVQPAAESPRRRVIAGAALLLAAMLVAACQPGGNLPPLPPPETTAYTLGPGDQVRIITFGEQTLTGQFSVEDSGNVAIPLLGPLHAAGLTTQQVSEAIAADLRAKNLIRNPSVSVEIVAYRPVFVLGEINKPGEYPYRPGMTMLTVVALAGGFTYRAVEDSASVVRNLHGTPTEGRVGRDALLQPGDVVTVFERNF